MGLVSAIRHFVFTPPMKPYVPPPPPAPLNLANLPRVEVKAPTSREELERRRDGWTPKHIDLGLVDDPSSAMGGKRIGLMPGGTLKFRVLESIRYRFKGTVWTSPPDAKVSFTRKPLGKVKVTEALGKQFEYARQVARDAGYAKTGDGSTWDYAAAGDMRLSEYTLTVPADFDPKQYPLQVTLEGTHDDYDFAVYVNYPSHLDPRHVDVFDR